jgi:hypothetical protein
VAAFGGKARNFSMPRLISLSPQTFWRVSPAADGFASWAIGDSETDEAKVAPVKVK